MLPTLALHGLPDLVTASIDQWTGFGCVLTRGGAPTLLDLAGAPTPTGFVAIVAGR